jgi:hypothetical protein
MILLLRRSRFYVYVFMFSTCLAHVIDKIASNRRPTIISASFHFSPLAKDLGRLKVLPILDACLLTPGRSLIWKSKLTRKS